MDRGPRLHVGIEDPTESHHTLTAAVAEQESVSMVDGETNDVDLIIAVGVRGVRTAVESGSAAPILAVGVDAKWSPAPAETATVAALLKQIVNQGTETPTTTHHKLMVSVAETEPEESAPHATKTASAVADCTVITSDPARISEYSVATTDRPMATFRADGVVIATPFGSTGYSRAAGGPRLAPHTGVAVVPIAPFAMQADQWVVDWPLSVRVKRDTPVSVYADERPVVEGRRPTQLQLKSEAAYSLIDWQWLESQQAKLETL